MQQPQEQELQDGELGISQFNYHQIKKSHFIVVIHPDPEQAARFVSKLLRRHRFHTGNIYSVSPHKYQHCFPYPSQHESSLNKDTAQDIWLRQSGHLPTEVDRERLEEVQSRPDFDDAARRKLIKRLQPAHCLPRSVFRDNLPESIFHTINRCLLIPDAYLVLHHCLSGAVQRQPVLRKCLLAVRPTNLLMRIVTLPPINDLTSAFYTACDYLFVFAKNPEELVSLFQRAKLNRYFHSVDAFVALQTAQNDLGGLVVAQNVKGKPTLSKAAKPIDLENVHWTTDIVRNRRAPD